MNTFIRETLINGEPARMECLEFLGQTYALSRGVPTTVQLEDEWFEDVRDPKSVIAALKEGSVCADIFTFWQRLPHTRPEFDFHREWESIAALPVTTFDHWWNKQIRPVTRNLIRKAEKKGVEVREARYDDEFVRGMTEIFNEVPVRQGRRFWHYGKDFETVKQQFSRYLFREDLLGAYFEDELIGFIMLADAGDYGSLGQIISKIGHRDKSPNNALIAKAVELCAKKRLPHLVYAYWGDGSLVDFKRHNGFAETRLPRYYVPLTRRGQLAITLGLHRGWKKLLPARLRGQLKSLRSRWLSLTTTKDRTSCPE
jgi:hypothetical protein